LNERVCEPASYAHDWQAGKIPMHMIGQRLKVPKRENFIVMDFRDFFTKQTPWYSDQQHMIQKIICNGLA